MKRGAFALGAAAASAVPGLSFAANGSVDEALQLRFVTDEADAVLRILDARAAGTVRDDDWRTLFATEGYRRLIARETAFKRPLGETEFRAFVTSDALLAQRAALRAALGAWSRADVGAAGRKALAYLPRGSRMRASVYAEIKPQANSFVFDLEHDPGIFLYLDPAVTATEFAYTVAHELHHVGFEQNCPPPQVKRELAALPPRLRLLATWLGGFGEGFAVLAGAGGVDVDPGTLVRPDAAPEWASERTTFAARLAELTDFFRGILTGRLDSDAARTAAMRFYGNQGAWYTVGWRMAVTVERRFGRERLIACIADHRPFLNAYNAASGDDAPKWPDDVARAFG